VVVAEAAELVLHLDRDDRAALERGETRDERVEPGPYGGREPWVRAADRDVSTGEPARQAAVGPLRADVRARPDDDVEALVAHHADEPLDVPPAVEARRLVLVGLVEVPRDVGVDRVESQVREPPDPVPPEVRVDTEVVQPAGQDPVGHAVPVEASAMPGEHGVGSRLGQLTHMKEHMLSMPSIT
jgi:hypothetical protein